MIDLSAKPFEAQNAKTICSVMRAAALFCVLASALLVPAYVWASKSNPQNVTQARKTQPPLVITLGKADLIDVQGDVSDILVADPSVVDVIAVQSNRLYLVGTQVGDTNLIAVDANGDIVKRIDIHVTYDLQAIQSLVEELFPEENVKVGSIHDQILLTGSVSTPDAASKITNIVGHYVSDLQDEDSPVDELISNLLSVRGEQQVSLQVKIVEATRSVFKELGISTDINDPNELAASTVFGTTQPGSVSDNFQSTTLSSASALAQPALATLRILRDTEINGIGTLGIFLDALEEENLVNVLAEPNLTAVSGEQAGFLAGGEFPVPSGLDNVGNVTIEFREFGVSLNFRPVVLSDKRISLQLDTEVSSLDFESAVTLGGVVVPGRSIRRADTTVEIPSGGSLMIAGLLQSEAVEGFSGLPGISKTPILGDLVKSDSFQRDETELVVIVTPYLVEPYTDNKRADPVPKQKNNPLAKAFAINIRRAYEVEDDELFASDEVYGYLLN